jgi:ketosteroid isomerase-like protein
VVDSCDWVRVDEGRIQEIRSFYDSARIREVLSTEEQRRLDTAD